MCSCKDVPTETDFLAWYDTLSLEMQREVYAEICRQYEALGFSVIPIEADFAQAAFHLYPRAGALIFLN